MFYQMSVCMEDFFILMGLMNECVERVLELAHILVNSYLANTRLNKRIMMIGLGVDARQHYLL